MRGGPGDFGQIERGEPRILERNVTGKAATDQGGGGADFHFFKIHQRIAVGEEAAIQPPVLSQVRGLNGDGAGEGGAGNESIAARFQAGEIDEAGRAVEARFSCG